MRFTLTACVLALATTPPLHAQNDAAYRERVRFDTCLGQVQIDATDALERAQAWRIEGGGWPAEVCEARALIALGEGEIGADILVNLADGTAIGMVDAERTELLTLAGDTRFMAGQLDDAAAAYDAALALQPDAIPARLARAGLHAGRNDWAALSTDAERLIEIAPWLAAGWRYRGQVRLATGQLDLAWQDMQRAREQEPDDIPTLLLRGAILEARRQAAAD
ncbi:hypothetical protein [Maricaulis maris]|uniref:Uncharacterized protein n=1 Tax=Maricaulis maris TaxID=74318 RepID=A0A495D2R9_9PROT|nr:hypothetical protein [Maricaulis maris]RKQ96057.1 hypothetical protein C7435_2309 [Maricaulis maris]